MSFVNETKSTPIQNDTGANVRADINSNMAAIYSLNASSSEPSAANSVARMIWADESNNELKIRNGTNTCLLYTSPSPRDMRRSRMPSSA